MAESRQAWERYPGYAGDLAPEIVTQIPISGPSKEFRALWETVIEEARSCDFPTVNFELRAVWEMATADAIVRKGWPWMPDQEELLSYEQMDARNARWEEEDMYGDYSALYSGL